MSEVRAQSCAWALTSAGLSNRPRNHSRGRKEALGSSERAECAPGWWVRSWAGGPYLSLLKLFVLDHLLFFAHSALSKKPRQTKYFISFFYKVFLELLDGNSQARSSSTQGQSLTPHALPAHQAWRKSHPSRRAPVKPVRLLRRSIDMRRMGRRQQRHRPQPSLRVMARPEPVKVARTRRRQRRRRQRRHRRRQ